MSAAIKSDIGIIDNLVILERESYEILMTDLKDTFKIEKAV